jgi:phage-related protein
MRSNEPDESAEKELRFMAGVRDNIRRFPPDVRVNVGHTLWRIEKGDTPDNVSPFEGSASNEIMKIVERHDTDTYRVVYATKFEKAIYVLHAFKKKSTTGRATPRREIDTVLKRLAAAKDEYKALYG